MRKSLVPLSPFWLYFSAGALSLSWLLPNHTPPWTGFHGDAWAAISLLVVAVLVSVKIRTPLKWTILDLALCVIVPIPLLQYAFGLITVFGVAWINMLYLLGLLIAVRCGSLWESAEKGRVGDYIFLAVAIAGCVSVGIQLLQWQGIRIDTAWILGVPSGSRFYANLAQPNKLASLQLLAVLACSWAVLHNRISWKLAFGISCWLLVGMALTGSRTAWVNVALLLVGVIFWRHWLPTRRSLYYPFGLFSIFVILVFILPSLLAAVQVDGASAIPQARVGGDSARLEAWRILGEATWAKPLYGYGWGQLSQASFDMVDIHPDWHGLFTQSHNIVLDLVLWNGYPIGLGIVAIAVWWVVQVVRSAKNLADLHLIGFVLILTTHAMLEFPLQYANFLLPWGLVLGALNLEVPQFRGLATAWPSQFVLVAAGAIALTVTVGEYMRIEQSFYALRFEYQKIKTDLPQYPKSIVFLNQFSNYFRLARYEPVEGMSQPSLQKMDAEVTVMPSALIMYKMAFAYAINNDLTNADRWLRRLCNTSAEVTCNDMRERWEQQFGQYPLLANARWPVD